MITIRKLATLAPRSRLRKIARLFHQCAHTDCHPGYLTSLITMAQDTAVEVLGAEVECAFLDHLRPLVEADDETLALALEDAYHLLLAALGESVADWDFEDGEGALDRSKRIVFERFLVLDRVRSPYNVGSIFRSADSFGIKKILLIEGSADPEHSRSIRTSGGTVTTVDYEILTQERLFERLICLGLPLFALESGGEDIERFTFPKQGIGVVGSEELGVSAALLELCERSLGRVTIGLGGTKGSLNVSVASAIMLQRWYVG